MDTATVRDVLATAMARVAGAELVYLFGSQVDGNVGPMSYYDLAVLVEDGADAAQVVAQLGHEAALALGTDRVHVVPLGHAPVELAFAVISQGVVVFQRDIATRVEYEATVMSQYGDYRAFLQAQRTEILQEGGKPCRVHQYRAALARTERTLGQIAAAQREAAPRV